MAYKSKNKDQYNAWRSRNLQGLSEAGVPERIAKNNRQFWFLVQEGEEIGYEGWNPDWISNAQASNLLDLLTGVIEDDRGWDLIDRLRRKLGRKQPRD